MPSSPRKFRPAGIVTYAKLLPGQPPFIKRQRAKGRYAVGTRYEDQVHEWMELQVLGRPGLEYHKGPWFEFHDQAGRRWCQPDGILLDRAQDAAVIYEVKYQHTPDAWWQLRELYLPVVRKAMPKLRVVGLCEIVHWHDPGVKFPERYDLTPDPFKIPHANTVAVYILNPKRPRPRGGVQLDGHRSSKSNGEAVGRERETQGPDGLADPVGSLSGGVVHDGSGEVSPGTKGSP